MIAFHYAEGLFVPVIVCDVCEQRIADGRLGVVVFRMGDLSLPELIPCMQTHKGECYNAAERKLGGMGECGWQELQTHLLYVVLNSKLTLEMLAEERDFRDAAGYYD
jgi:hypothetical protein